MKVLKRRLFSFVLAFVLMINPVAGYGPLVTVSAAADQNWANGITDEAQVAAKKAIWMDANKPVEDRVAALLSVMSLKEKAAQMVQPEQGSGGATPADVKNYGIGSVLSGGGSAPPSGNSAQNWADRVNDYKASALESRLGIPLIYGVDAVHGHNNVDNAVIFPHNIGLGASGNEGLVEAIGAAVAEEVRATGIQWTFAPTLGIPYSERWGRFYECFGETAEQVSALGAAYVKGFQGTGDNYFADNKIAASAKHYIGEGQTKNGQNQGDIDMTAAEFDAYMEETGLLEPYKAAIDAGARTVMVSYNSVDGVKCHDNYHLLTEILKGEQSASNPLGLGFTGFVVSDYKGAQQLTGTFNEKMAKSINAGVDMFMEPTDWKAFMTAVETKCEDGTATSISKERIDDAVSRILRVKFEMGLFEEKVADTAEKELLANFGSDAHRAVARQAVSESVTVLKNEKVGDKTALQCLKDAQDILVAGAKANDIGAQCGGWTISWQGNLDSEFGGKKVTKGTTILEGFKEVAKDGVTISGNGRGKVSPENDAVVVVVGEAPYAESDGDRTEAGLVLPTNSLNNDLSIIKTAINSAPEGVPMILLLLTGRPIAIADFIDDFDAVVEAWLPGTEGAGIADAMIGDKEFTGTLPVTWAWYPEYLSKKFEDSSLVLFPRGTGLRRDGTSINPGGQTSVPAQRPADPGEGGGDEGQSAIKYKGGIDIDKYETSDNVFKVEGEWAQPIGGSPDSYSVVFGSETVNDEKIDYVEWTGNQQWANAKWLVYIRQPGTYKVSGRMNITQGNSTADMLFGFGAIHTGGNNFVDAGRSNLPATSGYQMVKMAQGASSDSFTFSEPGLYGIKLQDNATGANALKAKLDYLELTLIEAAGEKETGEPEEEADPKDETPLQSQGNVVSAGAVNVYMTSSEKSQSKEWYQSEIEIKNKMEKKTSLDITTLDVQDLTTIRVDPTDEHQELLGLGTSLEESTVGNLWELKPSVRKQFIEDLVNPNKGGMTLFRITIGTADFTGQDFYTYYDAKTLSADNALSDGKGGFLPDWNNTTGKGFSIQKDIDYHIIETIKLVQEAAKKFGVEDEVKFFASSWTPPGWMKAETAASKSYKNNGLLLKGGKLADDHIKDLAMYYVRYLEEYAKLDIDIYAMTLQNEPLLEIDYPSCAMTGAQEGKLVIAIKDAVSKSKILNSEQKKVKCWAFDHNPGDAAKYVKELLQVEGANEALDGVAFHDYGGSLTNMQTMLDTILNQGKRKDQTVNLTERSVWGTSGANSIITYLRNGAISYNSWVTMLDSNISKHQWVGTPDPTMFARAAGSNYDYWATPEFYISGQFSAFIRPGYVRVGSNEGSESTVRNVVFKNPDTGELVAVVVNHTDKKQNFKIITDGLQFIGAIPAKNVATYVWSQPKNVHNNPEERFAAQEFKEASDGISKGSDTDGSYISMPTGNDYSDYIVNIKESGLYNITFGEKTSNNNQKIEIYQGDLLLRTINAVKHHEGKKVDIQGTISFDTVGMQNIRIKATSDIQIYNIKIEKAKDIHNMPGKINANEYIEIKNGIAAIENGTRLGSIGGIDGAWPEFYYKINVPADDVYQFTISTASDDIWSGALGIVGFCENDDGTLEEFMFRVNASDWGSNDYIPSNDWETFIQTSKPVTLTAGEHIIGFKVAGAINIEWLAVGSYMDMSMDGGTDIVEAQENGRVITVDISEGTIDEGFDVDGEGNYWKVTNLPKGVTANAVKKSAAQLEITLTGNRTVGFANDQEVGIAVAVKQGLAPKNTYAAESSFKIKALKLKKELILPEGQDLDVPNTIGGTKKIKVKIGGGTFLEETIGNISLSGGASSYYSLKNVKYEDPETIELELTYEKAFYRGLNLEIYVPATAYSYSGEQGPLTLSIPMNPVDGFPEAIPLGTSGVTLTEDKAFESLGSFKSGLVSGNYLDYFLDIEKEGSYVVVYNVRSLLGNGNSFENALDMNRGVPDSVGTNSYKQLDIPWLWTGTNEVVQIRQRIDFLKGKQAIEFKAKSTGFEIDSIEIVPMKIGQLDMDKNGTVKILATDFYDCQGSHAIISPNVEYTTGDESAFDYRINAVNSGMGTYDLQINYSTQQSNVKIKVQVLSDDLKEVFSKTIDAPSTGAWATYDVLPKVSMDLPNGEYTLRLNILGDGANLKYMDIKRTDTAVESISLDKTSQTLVINGTLNLQAMFVPESATIKDIKWSSSDPAVAKVEGMEDGKAKVTALKAGETIITAQSKSNLGAKATCKITVIKKNISNVTVTGLKDMTYTGSAIQPPLTVKDGNSILKSGTDYTLIYSNNVNAGTANVKISGKGIYTGDKSVTFKITAKSISEVKVTGNSDLVYTGKALTHKNLKVTDGSKTLKLNKDYTVKYTKNTNIGKGIITITGKGNYKLTKNVTFTIIPKKLANYKAKSPKTGQLSVQWKAPTGKAKVSGYQIQYSTDKKFKSGNKTKNVTKPNATISKLKTGKNYYVRVRAYKKVNGKTIYGPYTTAKKVKIKK